MKPSTLAAWLVVGLLALTPESRVLATDSKSYAGSTCVRVSGGTPYYNYSRFGNSHASSVLLTDCPVVKDGGSTASAWVRVVDRNPSQAVECTLIDLMAEVGSSTIYMYSSSDASAGSANSHQDLTFGALSTTSGGFKYFSCRIPPSYNGNVSYIANYFVTEN